jgi:GNAT superfamily N-acetyltransferase
MALCVRTLKATHRTGNFDSGSAILDNWLRTIAAQHQKKSISKTYVLVDETTPDAILGFFTLAIRKMTPKESMPGAIAKRLPPSIPGYTLARLAVAKKFQGQGLGATLLVSALRKARAAATKVGGVVVFVDAKDEQAAEFYKKHGFSPSPTEPLLLAIAISQIPE